MTARPRLTLVTPNFYPEQIGTPLYATDVARWFDTNGWLVTVITSQPHYPENRRHEGYGRHRRHDALGEIKIIRLPTIIPRQSHILWRAVSQLNFVLQGVSRRSPLIRSDAVITISPGTPWALLVGHRWRNKGSKHVGLIHDVQSGLAASLELSKAPLTWALRVSERLSISLADEVIVLTDEMASAVEELGVRKPVGVLPLWATIDPMRVPHPAAVPPSVQYSGNFGNKQGVELLTHLARRMECDLPGVQLILRGTGARFDQVQRSILQLGIPDVVFESPVPETQLAKALGHSPVHIVLQAGPSGRYAMPSKIVNALVCGCYVLAVTEGPSPLDSLAKKIVGLEVFERSDLDGVIRRSQELLASPDLPDLRARIARTAATYFDRDALLHRLEANLAQ